MVRIESDGRSTSGTITEVECYIGETDLACHARVGITERTKMLYGEPGTLYIYLIYGTHWMLNLVTESKGFPAAILIRSLFPRTGINIMKGRRNKSVSDLTNGPAKIAQAFGINNTWNGYNTCAPDSKLFVELDWKDRREVTLILIPWICCRNRLQMAFLQEESLCDDMTH